MAMARAELAKYNALVFQDKKLEEAGVKKGRLTLETRAAYEKKIKELEDALDSFHLSVAGYNKTKAMSVLSVEGFCRACEFRLGADFVWLHYGRVSVCAV